MQISHKPPFNHLYTPLVQRSGATADMLMDFGVLKLNGAREAAALPGWFTVPDRAPNTQTFPGPIYLIIRPSAFLYLTAPG